mgnify:CR=1 FL=1
MPLFHVYYIKTEPAKASGSAFFIVIFINIRPLLTTLQKCCDLGVIGERHAELAGCAAGLRRVGGIGHDEGASGVVEGFGRVGFPS